MIINLCMEGVLEAPPGCGCCGSQWGRRCLSVPSKAVQEANSFAKFYYDSEEATVFRGGGGREGVITLLSDRFHLPNLLSDHE